ncbi:hypothetical protein M3654_23165, partial [Bacillus licheniformis]|nr:hypothetical protein [Bacillus licheniformis]
MSRFYAAARERGATSRNVRSAPLQYRDHLHAARLLRRRDDLTVDTAERQRYGFVADAQRVDPQPVDAFRQGRKVLALTERTEHIDAIRTALTDQVPEPFVLHGRMSKKQRAALIAALDALSPDAPRVLLATGKLVGEGFDHP